MDSLLPAGWLLPGVLIFALFLLGLVAFITSIVRVCMIPPRWPELKERLQHRSLDGRTIAGMVAILAGLNGLFVAVIHYAFADSPDAREAAGGWILAAQTLTFHGAALALIFRAASRAGGSIGSRLGWNPHWGRAAGAGVWGYLAVFPLVISAGFIWRVVLEYGGVEIETQSFLQIMVHPRNPWLQAYLVFTSVVLVPVAEELLFRDVLLPFLTRRFGLIAAVLSCAALFAVLHFNVAAFLPIFVLGLGLGSLYALTGHILAPVMMHTLFNGVNLALLLYTQSGRAA
ncbi:MAG: CPBP family intramembrane metalloprotease [Kiritimatiellae bacterium]|nr:CPBP family intramembrane metalloprotease [Kiritimatiellia bacterium]